MLQRLMLSAQLLSCDGALGAPESVSVSPTGLSVGGGELRYVRGAVVGNVLVWSGASFLCAGVVAAVAAVRHLPLRRAAGSMRLPGGFVVVFVPLLQPTVSCIVQVLHLGGYAASIAIGTTGVLFILASAAWFAWVVTVGFAASPRRSVGTTPKGGSAFMRMVEWVDAPFYTWSDSAVGSRFVEEYGLLFCMFTAGRHWYVVVELAIGAVCGVIGGTIPAAADSGASVCVPQRVALVVVAVVELLLVLLLRPPNTRLRTAAMLTNSATLIISSSLVLANQRAAGTVTVVGVAVVIAATAIALTLPLASIIRRLLHRNRDVVSVPLRYLPHSASAGEGMTQSGPLEVLVRHICLSRTGNTPLRNKPGQRHSRPLHPSLRRGR
jgi:hypothetical protein